MPDPQSRRGVRHTLTSILLIVICALAAGKGGFTHIETWARDAPDEVLRALDVRLETPSGGYAPPDEKTIRVALGRIVDSRVQILSCNEMQIRTVVAAPYGCATVRRDDPT